MEKHGLLDSVFTLHNNFDPMSVEGTIIKINSGITLDFNFDQMCVKHTIWKFNYCRKTDHKHALFK